MPLTRQRSSPIGIRSYAVTQLRSYAVTQLRSYAVTQLRSYTVTQLRKAYWDSLTRKQHCALRFSKTLLEPTTAAPLRYSEKSVQIKRQLQSPNRQCPDEQRKTPAAQDFGKSC